MAYASINLRATLLGAAICLPIGRVFDRLGLRMTTVLASAIGPMIFAQSAAMTGSYFPALWILAPCVLLLSAAAFRVRLPNAVAIPASS